MDEEPKIKRRLNPKENASIFSIATFFFTLPTFIEGFKKDLTQSDIYDVLPEHKSAVLGDKLENLWNKEVKKCEQTKKKPSLCIPLIKMFLFDNVVLGLMMFTIEVILRPTLCILIGQLISFYSSNLDLTGSKHEIYLYGGGVILLSLLISAFVHPYMLKSYDVGLKIRISCSTLIYRKMLKLKIENFSKTSSGKILTLITNDSNRFFSLPLVFHYLWTGVFQTILITYLLDQEFEISAIFGICFMLIFIPIYVVLGKITKNLRFKTIIKTDDRVRVMKEVISGIQVIKMYNWEKYFSNLTSFYRRMEINSVRVSSYIKGIYTIMYLFIQRTCVFITILAFVLLGNTINAEKTFKLVCFYAAFRNSMIFFFPKAISLLSESIVPLNRLSTFLLYEEVDCEVINQNTQEEAINIQKVSVKKTGEVTNELLSGINLHIKRNNLVAIIGSVGCGKTSLLHVILKELSVNLGTVRTSGSFSYAPQEPWIFTGSVRQNVIFSNQMDIERYNTVLNVCALAHDLRQLPHQDLTIVGDRGASLSGGQRARINLARAVYQNADIYILDDPLSAVDSRVGKLIFDQCIKTFLREKTVILVTHQMQYLQLVDKIVVLNDGAIVAEGSFTELLSQGLDFERFLDETEENMVIQDEPSYLNSATPEQYLSTNSTNVPKVEEEKITTGVVTADVYKTYFTIGSHKLIVCWMIILFLVTQAFVSCADYFLAYWVNLEQARITNVNETYADFSIDVCIYIYSSLILGIIAFGVATIISLHNLCMRSSIQLHNTMFNSVINAPISFFYLNQSGRILNRFSKDMEIIDEELPIIMNDTFQLALNMIGIVVVISIVNYVVLIPAAISMVLLYYVRKFYLVTSRSLKRLDGTTRSPVLSHVNTTFQGITTIRAFGAQNILLKEFNDHQNLNSSTHYIYVATSRSFGYYVDLICVAFNASVIFLLLSTNDTFGGNVGLTISQCLGLLGILQFVIRQYSEMENCMTSVERVLEYNELEQERGSETVMLESPSPAWPENGSVTFNNVCLYYSTKDPPVLNYVSVAIKPMEKIGIVGRTGAGKSSLINALFRLSKITGTITIDEIDIKDLPLHYLRSKISIIPQQPTIFSGSLRNNLDPFNEYTDTKLWQTLDKVELKPVINNLLEGLNAELTESGFNFSLGQRQLICLARAVLRNNKILILDEATANVDPQTDALIQKTVRENFFNCTVLTIAHRLDTVIDSDKILVMEDGKVVEFDHPHILLQNSSGVFYSMVQQVAGSMTESLKTTARENYNHMKSSKQGLRPF